MSMRIAYEKN